MNIKKNIPNFITCCNLLCGCLAIVFVFNNNLIVAAYLVGLAAIFDFFDGFVARLLRVSSPIGKDLDSLADMVTFGVVPSVFLFQLLSYKCAVGSYLPYVAFLVAIFSAIRLAKFNNDTRQSTSFIGLPTPANAIFICSLPLVLASINDNHNLLFIYKLIDNPWFLIGVTILNSFLLIAELPLFALKFKSFTWKRNEIRFVFLSLAILFLIVFQFLGIPLIILIYVIMSIISNYTFKKQIT